MYGYPRKANRGYGYTREVGGEVMMSVNWVFGTACEFLCCALTYHFTRDKLHQHAYAFPWSLFKNTVRRQTTCRQTSLSPGTGTDYTEDRQAFLWDPFQSAPEERLHIQQQTSLPQKPLLEHTRGPDSHKNIKAFPWCPRNLRARRQTT